MFLFQLADGTARCSATTLHQGHDVNSLRDASVMNDRETRGNFLFACKRSQIIRAWRKSARICEWSSGINAVMDTSAAT
jgi:hypothetical protein